MEGENHMKNILKERLALLRDQIPAGSRILLKEMCNDPFPVKPGTWGTLNYIDDIGQLHVDWDTGSTLALIIGVDHFTVLSPTTLQKTEF